MEVYLKLSALRIETQEIVSYRESKEDIFHYTATSLYSED
jgi:hypothetical protein